ncbi:DUF4097 family beta strand repeat protein [candidate division KSB1 bacterium]|nr:DUF4097 family beta strand repeat protein [candidate division KSB1 bacterium]
MLKKVILFLPVVLLIGRTTVFGGTITREYHKQHEFDGDEVSIETVNGKIFIETWDQDVVDVYAEIQVRASNKNEARKFLEDVEIVVRRRNDRLNIRVEKPHDSSGGFWDWIAGIGKPSLTVNFAIKVPEEMDVDASSVNGSIDVVGVAGNVSLSTTNGKIAAEDIRGSVEAETTNGSINVDISTSDLQDDVRLHTVNGSIKLALDRDVEADIDISTVNGSINTDFPLEVRGQWGPKNVSGEINGGGARIALETVNGSVSILER